MISGRGSNLSALIAASMASDFPGRIIAVLSDVPDAAGLDLARDCDIETKAYARGDYESRAAHESALLEKLDELKPDLICLAGFMRLLSAEFVSRWRGLILNIHPSLLPSFPGLDTHQRVLAHQVRIHGCSVHFVTEGMDEGPLVAQAAVPVMPDDTEDSLAARVLKAEHRLYPAAVRLVAEGKIRMTDAGETVFNGFSENDSEAMIQSPVLPETN
jgi:formyltetrahydrofolate-dependent phosphoribosylglycinamide formyltransferase